MSYKLSKYSSIVFNQNITPTGNIDLTDSLFRFQEFYLPDNYIRGTDVAEQIIPDISGFQILLTITSEVCILNWSLDHYVLGVGWETLNSGTSIGSHAVGNKIWLTVDFDRSINLAQIDSDRFRIGISDSGDIPAVWFTSPNPISTFPGNPKAYETNGTTPILDGSDEVSFCFRILALVADEGIDYLGDKYRSGLVILDPNNINTESDQNISWMSKPNPSRFAVESLYFDIRPQQEQTYDIDNLPNPIEISNNSSVIDHIIIDPTTPNICFNIYYSNEGNPGTNETEWENKLWIHVPKTYQAIQRESFPLPSPINTKYIKLEFSHLQAKQYSPGMFSQPVKYKKHPKWVLDYFLGFLEETNRTTRDLISTKVNVIFDALDFAYNYYLDDLNKEPDLPVTIDPSFQNNIASFLNNQSDISDQVDPITLSKIKLVLDPYRQSISGFAKTGNILGDISIANSNLDFDYSVERGTTAYNKTIEDIKGLRNEQVLFEQDFPIMFFYLTCRHTYREVLAKFTHERAYFAGIREVAFVRENYEVANDNSRYIENAGDLFNTEINDFTDSDGLMIV